MWIARGVTGVCVKQESPQTIKEVMMSSQNLLGTQKLGTGTLPGDGDAKYTLL
jgi:hypothetical protein